jgi:hypothetical protein
MHTIHKVVSHIWHEGQLKSFINSFASFEQAMNFARSLNCHAIKVYDHNEELVHTAGNVEDPATYA